VVGTYLLLWSSLSATQGGATPADAAAKGGLLTAIVQVTALVWAAVFGFLSSKMHRLTALAIAMALGILIVSLIGGWLFDVWRPSAPFLLMAGANLALLVWTLVVRRAAPGPARGTA
jgi:hypothetical protein